MRDESDPFALPDNRFIDLYRLNKDLVHYLFETLMPYLQENRRSTRLCPQIRILIALRFFATGNYQRGIGEEFLLSASQQAVSRCITEIAYSVVANLANEWIKFPTTNQRKMEIKGRFMEKAGFPGIIGAVDGTHVAIIAPREQEHIYVNRKLFHAKNVQIICSHDNEILNINSRYPGSTNDAFIW